MHAPRLALPVLGAVAAVALASCSSATDVGAPEPPSRAVPLQANNCNGGGCGLLKRLPRAPTFSASTLPGTGSGAGEVNPYGVAFVSSAFPTTGLLTPGAIVVSNFNDAANEQGTGTTIVQVASHTDVSLFYTESDPTFMGLTTALGVLSKGYVVVGSAPSTNQASPGTCTTLATDVGDGALTFVDAHGSLVTRLTGETIAAPWDLAVFEENGGNLVHIFVSNAKSGNVSRVDIDLSADTVGQTVIAGPYPHRCDPAAFVVGPTGLAYDAVAKVLYVASTGDNAIYAVADPLGAGSVGVGDGKGHVAVASNPHFHGPLGLVIAGNGDLVSSQGDAVNPGGIASAIVEFTPSGKFVAEFSIDRAPGSAFGMAISSTQFAAVDDGINVLDVWSF